MAAVAAANGFWLERGDEAMNLNAMDEIVIAVNQFGMPACITWNGGF
jgi:hypothetical protein